MILGHPKRPFLASTKVMFGVKNGRILDADATYLQQEMNVPLIEVCGPQLPREKQTLQTTQLPNQLDGAARHVGFPVAVIHHEKNPVAATGE